MAINIGGVGPQGSQPFQNQPGRNPATRSTGAQPQDRVDFGAQGRIDVRQTIQIVTERSMAQLRSVVDQARAELNLPEGSALDTSAEATAGRIADFALGAFDVWRQGREELSDDEARSQFAEFIGAAINRGIEEARGILTALNAMNGETTSFVDEIQALVQQRLENFVTGEDA